MLVYIACPYGHSNTEIIKRRMELFHLTDAHFTNKGLFIVSPMNKIATVEKHNLCASWNFWENYSYTLLSKCGKIIVMTIDGWKESHGVQSEISYAKSNNIEVEYFDPHILEAK